VAARALSVESRFILLTTFASASDSSSELFIGANADMEGLSSILLNNEVLTALLGAAVALLLSMLQASAASSSGAGRPLRRHLQGPSARPGLMAAAFLASGFGGICVHAAKHAIAEGAFSVKLRRQQIPLHSEDGIVYHKSAYYGQISVGGPVAQEFEVVFDTGSGHLVLPSIMCRSDTCRNHRRYRRRASELAVDIDVDGTPVEPTQARDQITVSFGTGEVTGIFVQDQVCLGPAEPMQKPTAVAAAAPDPRATAGASLLQVDRGKFAAAVASPREEDEREGDQNPQPHEEPARPPRHGCVDMRLISATDMSEDPFGSFQFDGVLGLGLPSLSQTKEFNFLEAAAPAGAWTSLVPGAERMFAVFLAKSDDEEQSEITFGGWRSEHVKDESELAFCHVQNVEDGYWQLDVFGIKVDGQHIDFCNEGCRAIVDTGTSLLGVPSALGPELVDLLRHPAGTGGACGGPGPRLEIDLGNFTVFLDPADYARPEVVLEEGDGVEEVQNARNNSIGASTPTQACVPMVMHIDLPSPLHPRTLILGEPILQRFYTIFDATLPARVGFAEARHASGAVPQRLV